MGVGRLYIWINRFFFRIKGVEFGENLRVRGPVGIQNYGRIVIGNNFSCLSATTVTFMLNPLARNIACSFRTDKGGIIKIGDHTGISSSCIWARQSVTIGSHVKIGALCIIMDTDAHSLNSRLRSTKHDSESALSKPIVIEDNVLIGTSSIILKGVTIGENSVVGAGSVVTKSVPANQIWAGNPAKFIRNI